MVFTGEIILRTQPHNISRRKYTPIDRANKCFVYAKTNYRLALTSKASAKKKTLMEYYSWYMHEVKLKL